ncbi:MAG: FG-GAP-like repeat-containing protein, partial [Pirellulaceae bacterium]|nr:FG-GAP-like repeat-containing protein [Pirellulaceae bacterium]
MGDEFTISFSLAEPDPGDDTIVEWSVDWGDGVVETLPSDAGSATHRYETTGNFVVTVTATDEDGSYTQEVDPVVSPPVPAISTVVSVADLTIREGDGVTLLATAPGSPSFAWDLDGIDQGGDGDRFDDAVGAEVKFEWEELIGLGIGDSGSYTVRVQATYTDYGANTTQSREGTATLTVENVAPTAVLTSSTRISGVPILEGGTATVRFQGQNDPSPADATAGFRYFYDFEDDGIFEIANSTEPTVDVPSEFLDDDGELLVRAVIADKDAVDAGGNIKQGAATSEYFTSVAVRNVVPTLTNLQATAAVENQSTTLTGEIVDAGTADAFTLTVKWGDGSEQSFYYPAGTSSFSETHLYLDDPAGSSSDKYTIQLTVDDGDDGIGLAQAVVSVDNVAPVLNNLTVTSTLNEGETATLSGVIADLGTNDSFTLTVDWGDGSLAETTAFEVGTTTFSLSHPYPDEGLYSVSVALQDDDAGLDQPATGLTVTVKNVPPSLTNVTLTPVINEGDAATLSGEITLGQLLNAGTQGSFRLMVDWGDGSAKQIFRYPAGTTSFSETHTYADNPTGTEDFPVTVTLFDDSLGFLPAQISTTTGSTGGDVEGDFNHDGHLDLAVASEAEGTVRLLLGDGMGGYSEQLRFTGKARPQAVLYADFNQDGIADRVRTNKYFELDLSGFNFAVADAAAIRQAVFDTLNCGVLSDTNGDGEITPDDVVIDMVDTEPDDVAETFVITARIVSQEGLKEKIWDALLMNPTCLPAGFTWSDMPDPTVADQLDVSLGTGDAGLYMAVMGSPTGGQASAIATADFNNDGKPDLALVTSAGGVVVQMGTGDGTFSAPTVLPIGTGVASDVIAEDLNEDGVADVAVAVPESHQVRVLYGAGDGSFAADDNGPVTMAGFAAAGLRAVDFNADGLVDLLAFSRSDGPVYAILGEMVGDEREFADPARIADPRTFPAGSDPRYLAVGDFDGDGRLDLAVASSSSETVLVLLGDGTGGLSTPYDFAVGAVPTGLSVADHNDDGRLDLIAATATTSNPDGARVLLREPVSQVTGNVSVANVAPTLTVSGAETVGAEATYTLSLSSSDPGDDVIMSWLINWGDESPEETIDGDVAAVTHTYTGGLESYTILAVASDEDGTYPQISKTISVAKVAADQPKVSVNEGSLATNTGTYRGLGDTVEITASLGSISHNGGTWNWSYNPADGPDASQPVTITATYGEGQVSTTFALAVVNVAPTATLSHNGPITYGQTVTVGFTEPFDPSDDDVAVGFHYAFATSPAVFSDVSYDSGSNANATFTFEELAAGDHTLYARIIDKDGGFNEYSIDMTVNKALLTVKADNQTKVYGAAEPELTYTPSGTLFYTDTYHVISGVVLATATGADATA